MDKTHYMFQAGFFGTRAPLFMDMVTLIVALLPILVYGAIAFARSKMYKTHAYTQILIFLFTVIVLIYFETGVRIGGGFNAFMDGSGVSHNYAFFVLIFHIAVSVMALIIWFATLFRANKWLKLGIHKKLGQISYVGIVMTSLTGIWVYLILFVY